MVSAKYAVVFESISATCRSYFIFHMEKLTLNIINTNDQIKITNAINVLIKEITITIVTTLIAKESKSQRILSANFSKDLPKRLTFCTKEPVKLFVKKPYECSIK